MSTPNVQELYNSFFELANAEDGVKDHENEYFKILRAIRSTTQEKLLASQFITRFFHQFPQLTNVAFDAFLNLCEDDDPLIRKQAIKDLPDLCKESKEHTTYIVDVLSQLLAVEDISELEVVYGSIKKLIKLNTKEALREFFRIIQFGEEDTRSRCVKVLKTILKTIEAEFLTEEIEEFIISECKNVVQDVSAEDFRGILEMLSVTKLGRTDNGKQELMVIIIEQAQLDVPFSPAPNTTDLIQCKRLIVCIECALPYCAKQKSTSKFIFYICTQVLTSLIFDTSAFTINIQLKILQLLAELIKTCQEIEEPLEVMKHLYNTLKTFMPLPSQSENNDEPKLQFSYVECLIYAFHQLYKRNLQFSLINSDEFKEFRLRLLYFARETMKCHKKFQVAVTDFDLEKNQLKIIALRTTSNIHKLILDFFYKQPTFSTIIVPSWKINLSKELKTPLKPEEPVPIRKRLSSIITKPKVKDPKIKVKHHSPSQKSGRIAREIINGRLVLERRVHSPHCLDTTTPIDTNALCKQIPSLIYGAQFENPSRNQNDARPTFNSRRHLTRQSSWDYKRYKDEFDENSNKITRRTGEFRNNLYERRTRSVRNYPY